MFESLEGCLKHAISTKKHTCVLARALRHVVIFAILRNIVKRIEKELFFIIIIRNRLV